MKNRASLVFSAFTLIGTLVLAAEEPTPTPQVTQKKKLKGGSFGLLPAPTPTGGPSRSGSLADAARKTQEDADSGQKPSRGVVITNETLRKGTPPPTVAASPTKGSTRGKPNARALPTPVPAPTIDPEYRDASGRTEADWRKRAAIARERIERAVTGQVGAREEVKRLENDFYAWSDGNYRERVIRPAWDQAKGKLQLLETEAEAARAGMAELEEEARKSGTPPGWLR